MIASSAPSEAPKARVSAHTIESTSEASFPITCSPITPVHKRDFVQTNTWRFGGDLRQKPTPSSATTWDFEPRNTVKEKRHILKFPLECALGGPESQGERTHDRVHIRGLISHHLDPPGLWNVYGPYSHRHFLSHRMY